MSKGRQLPATWAQDQILMDRIDREARIARAWVHNYEAHKAEEAETEELRATLRAQAEAGDCELQRRLRRSRFQHQNAARYFTTGTKGRISGYSGHVAGEKHVLGVQKGEYADYRWATQFDGEGRTTAVKQHLTALSLKHGGAEAAAVAAALPLEIEVQPERAPSEVAAAPPVADMLDAEQKARVAATVAFIRSHGNANYTGHTPGSSSVVGL